MKLFDTSMAPSRLQRNSDDFAEVRRIADSGNDHPVLMLNMNRYMPDSGFPDRGAYHDYITGLGPFLEGAGARLLWRFPVLGHAVGDSGLLVPAPSKLSGTLRGAGRGREFPPQGRVR